MTLTRPIVVSTRYNPASTAHLMRIISFHYCAFKKLILKLGLPPMETLLVAKESPDDPMYATHDTISHSLIREVLKLNT
jgi:hypothetical protein